jgi:hypothetical protein
MKKTMSALGAIFMAAALFITGCESPTMPDPIAAANDELNNQSRTIQVDGDGFALGNTPITPAPVGTLYNVDNAEFIITFNLGTNSPYISPDKDKLKDALEILELTEKTGAALSDTTVLNPPTGSNLLTEVVSIQKTGTNPVARIRANLSGVTHSAILVHIKAGIFTANGGNYKLNLDNDLTSGEREDDYYGYLAVSDKGSTVNWTPITGTIVVNNPRAGIPRYVTLGRATGSLPTSLLNQITVFFTAYPNENYTTFLNSNVKIDKYDAASGTWSPAAVTVSGFTRSVSGSSSSYTAPFTSAEGDVLRARITGLQGWETTNNYYGFPQKYTTRDNAGDEDVFGDVAFSTDRTQYTSASIVDAVNGVTVVGSNEARYVKITLDSGVTDRAAISSVTPDTIKIIVTEEKTVGTNTINSYREVKWESVGYEYSTWNDAGTEKSYPSAILLKLPESYKTASRSFAVYITPNVTVGTGTSAKKAQPDITNGGFYTLGNNVFTGIANKVDAAAGHTL